MRVADSARTITTYCRHGQPRNIDSIACFNEIKSIFFTKANCAMPAKTKAVCFTRQ